MAAKLFHSNTGPDLSVEQDRVMKPLQVTPCFVLQTCAQVGSASQESQGWTQGLRGEHGVTGHCATNTAPALCDILRVTGSILVMIHPGLMGLNNSMFQ